MSNTGNTRNRRSNALSHILHVPHYSFVSSFPCFLHPFVLPPFPVVLKTPIDSVLHLSATMTFADFCVFSTASFPCAVVTPFGAFHTDLPGYHTFLSSPSICHIYHPRFRVVIGLRLVWQPYPRE